MIYELYERNDHLSTYYYVYMLNRITASVGKRVKSIKYKDTDDSATLDFEEFIESLILSNVNFPDIYLSLILFYHYKNSISENIASRINEFIFSLMHT